MLLWFLPHRSLWAGKAWKHYLQLGQAQAAGQAGAGICVGLGRQGSKLEDVKDINGLPVPQVKRDQPCPQPSAALGSSPYPSLQTCAPRPGSGSFLTVSQLLEAAVFVLQLVVAVMSLMGPAVWAASFH